MRKDGGFGWLFGWLLVVLALSCSGPQRRVESQALGVLAHAANAVAVPLWQSYQREGDAAIDRASSPEEARRAVAAVRLRWAPIWAAWEDVRIAQDALAAVLDVEGEPDGAKLDEARRALGAAFCRLRERAPAVPLPELPGLRCEVTA